MRKYFYFPCFFSMRNIKRNSTFLMELCSCIYGLCWHFILIAMFNRLQDFIDSPFNFISKDKKILYFYDTKENQKTNFLAYCI